RARLVPALHEADKFGDMRRAGRHQRVDLFGYVVHAEPEMPVPLNALRRVDHRLRIEKAHEMRWTNFPDRIFHSAEGAHINHHSFLRAFARSVFMPDSIMAQE